MNEIYNDDYVIKKLNSGGVLTPDDMDLLLDDNTAVDNIVKKSFQTMLENSAIEATLERKLELKCALLACLNSLYEHKLWEYKQEQGIQTYLQQVSQVNAQSDDTVIQEVSHGPSYLQDFFTQELNYIPHDLSPAVTEKVAKQLADTLAKESSNKSKPTVGPRAVKEVLHISTHNPKLREYLFERHKDHNDDQHSEQIVQRIMHVANILKNTPIDKLITNAAKSIEHTLDETFHIGLKRK